jgi:hypothetical protein
MHKIKSKKKNISWKIGWSVPITNIQIHFQKPMKATNI